MTRKITKQLISILPLLACPFLCFGQQSGDTARPVSITWSLDKTKVKDGNTAYRFVDVKAVPLNSGTGSQADQNVLRLADQYAAMIRDSLLTSTRDTKEVISTMTSNFKEDRERLLSGNLEIADPEPFDIRKADYRVRKFGEGINVGAIARVPVTGGEHMIWQVQAGLDFPIGNFYLRPGIGLGKYVGDLPKTNNNVSSAWLQFGYVFLNKGTMKLSAFAGPCTYADYDIREAIFDIFFKDDPLPKSKGLSLGLSADKMLSRRYTFFRGTRGKYESGVRFALSSDILKNPDKGTDVYFNLTAAFTLSRNGICSK